MEIKLDNPIKITITEAIIKEYNKISLLETRDDGLSVIAIMRYYKDDEIVDTKTTILWEGKEYEAVGQWTDSDVQNRILQLLAE